MMLVPTLIARLGRDVAGVVEEEVGKLLVGRRRVVLGHPRDLRAGYRRPRPARGTIHLVGACMERFSASSTYTNSN